MSASFSVRAIETRKKMNISRKRQRNVATSYEVPH